MKRGTMNTLTNAKGLPDRAYIIHAKDDAHADKIAAEHGVEAYRLGETYFRALTAAELEAAEKRDTK